MPPSARATAIEFDNNSALLSEVAELLQGTRDDARRVLDQAGVRLAVRFGLKTPPILVRPGSVQIEGVAGVIPIAPRVDLEVCPKFLGNAPGWQRDFFTLASLTGHSALITPEMVSSRHTTDAADLRTLIARSFVHLYRERARQTIKAYRRETWSELEIEGDLDCERIWERSEVGFAQRAIRFDERNPYNAVISAAAKVLLAHVESAELQADLYWVVRRCGPQGRLPQVPPPLPARDRNWRPVYLLAQQVLQDFDLTPASGPYQAPGFVVLTWQAWERFLALALRIGFGSDVARPKLGHAFAQRGETELPATPDCTMLSAQDPWLVDAKYIGRLTKGRKNIGRANIYEAYAFLHASGCSRIVLVSPRIPDAAALEQVGTLSVFDEVHMSPNLRVVGAEVEVRGLGSVGGLQEFSRTMAQGLSLAVGRAEAAAA